MVYDSEIISSPIKDTFPILTKLLNTYIESQTFRQYIV